MYICLELDEDKVKKTNDIMENAVAAGLKAIGKITIPLILQAHVAGQLIYEFLMR